MKKYRIDVIEKLSKTVEIIASDENEALFKIKELYNNCNIILYPEECDIEVNYEVIEKISFSN